MIEGAEGNNNWYISPVIVEIQEVKQETIPVEKITYRINGGEEELLPENKQIKLEEDGEYTIESFAYSKAGYKSKGATLTLKIEKSIQKLEMDLLADIKKLDIQVNAKAFSEITKYTYYLGKIGENGFVQYEKAQERTENTFSYDKLKEKTKYIIKVVAESEAGNRKEIIQEVVTKKMITLTPKNVQIIKTPETWTNGNVMVQLMIEGINNQEEIYQVQYRVDEGEWQRYSEAIELEQNALIEVRLTDGINFTNRINGTIENIDKLPPEVVIKQINVTTKEIEVSVEAEDTQSGIKDYIYYLGEETSEGQIEYIQYIETTENTYEFKNLKQATKYDVKVEVRDNVNNIGSSTLNDVVTKSITGTIAASNPTWSNQKAEIELSTTSGYTIQYKKGDSGTWVTGTSIQEIEHNTTIYMRLIDGLNYGNESSVTILDNIVPEKANISLNITNTDTTSNIEAKIIHMDNQSGVDITKCKWVYNTIAREIGTLEENYTGGSFSSNNQTINLPITNEQAYYLHILTVDYGGNTIETIEEIIPEIQVIQDRTISGVDEVQLTFFTNSQTGGITKIITPTGEISSSPGTYTIEQNGTYFFKIITDKNIIQTRTITIDNIKEDGINITNLIAGGEAHQHIYESQYDASYHWEECTICGNVMNKAAHTIVTTGNAATCDVYVVLGQEVCSANCGYSKQIERLEHIRPDILQWQDYRSYSHIAYQCERCGGGGSNSISEYHTFNIDGEILTVVQIREKGIDVHSLGTQTCTVCHLTVDLSRHNCYSRSCGLCGKELGPTMNFDVEQNNMKNGKIQIDLVNHETQDIYYQVDSKGYTNSSNSAGSIYGGNYAFTAPELVSQNGDIYLFKTTVSLKDRSLQITEQLTGIFDFYTTVAPGDMIEGYEMASTIRAEYTCDIVPDAVAPVIQNVQATNIEESDGWATSKKITVSGTEIMNEIVYISMYYPDGRAVFEKQAAVVQDGKYEFTTTPTIEAKEPTIFTVKVEDMFGNASTKELVLEKIDSKTPEISVKAESNAEWARSRKVTFEATDNGIGMVQISFNTQDDYQLGILKDGKYVRDYLFVGEAYETTTAMLYTKDGVGNLLAKKITIGKIDNTSPTITNITKTKSEDITTVTISANDRNEVLGKEGSGVSGYAITLTQEKPSDSAYQTSNVFQIRGNGTCYIWVKDKVGNLSERQELIIP